MKANLELGKNLKFTYHTNFLFLFIKFVLWQYQTRVSTLSLLNSHSSSYLPSTHPHIVSPWAPFQHSCLSNWFCNLLVLIRTFCMGQEFGNIHWTLMNTPFNTKRKAMTDYHSPGIYQVQQGELGPRDHSIKLDWMFIGMVLCDPLQNHRC